MLKIGWAWQMMVNKPVRSWFPGLLLKWRYETLGTAAPGETGSSLRPQLHQRNANNTNRWINGNGYYWFRVEVKKPVGLWFIQQLTSKIELLANYRWLLDLPWCVYIKTLGGQIRKTLVSHRQASLVTKNSELNNWLWMIMTPSSIPTMRTKMNQDESPHLKPVLIIMTPYKAPITHEKAKCFPKSALRNPACRATSTCEQRLHGLNSSWEWINGCRSTTSVPLIL